MAYFRYWRFKFNETLTYDVVSFAQLVPEQKADQIEFN